ncbi:MAG TPA: TIGR00303 family protein [Coleofasciculaceae cyanobacterium]|jgi:uncharacterized protein (TIGR00303 family)
MIQIYTQLTQGHQWLQQYQGRPPILACILGFTDTGLIPGISAAGATPDSRKYTAIADAEFLVNGVALKPEYPLPPLEAGASPVLISRAVVEAFDLPVYLFNAGLPQPPAVPAIDLGGVSAKCLTSGDAMPLAIVKQLFEQGLKWGQQLAVAADGGYLIISECVVGGTTTALSILTGLGFAAAGKVNSSHPRCNHAQKWEVVQVGLRRWRERECGGGREQESFSIQTQESQQTFPLCPSSMDPLKLVAAVGDPMQIVAAGMMIAASRNCGVLLAGGTQMLAVYALAQALAKQTHHRETVASLQGSDSLPFPCGASVVKSVTDIAIQDCLVWQPKQIVVGTTRWVVEDPTGDTVGLAQQIGNVPLLATELSFATSRYPQLQAYEQGYVKEGVGAGGCAIAAQLYKGWNFVQLLQAIEALVEQYCQR